MTHLDLVHFILVNLWFGIVLAETAMELPKQDDRSLLNTAVLHYRIDLFLEAPLVTLVLITGIILTFTRGPLPPILHWKIPLGLIAIAANYYCVCLVILRYRRRSDANEVRRLSRKIVSMWHAVPVGLAAYFLGIRLLLT